MSKKVHGKRNNRQDHLLNLYLTGQLVIYWRWHSDFNMLKVKTKDLVGFLDTDDSGGVHLIAADSNVFRQHSQTFTRTFLRNHDGPTKYLIHALIFDNNANFYKAVGLANNTMIIYDYFSREFEPLEKFHEEFRQNHNPSVRNIIVIDRLNILNCYLSHLSTNTGLFCKYLRKYAHKILLLINATAATSKELNEAYANSDLIALLLDKHSNQGLYSSYIIKNRPDAKPGVNKVMFDIVNGEIQQADEKTSKGEVKSDIDISALTTFKLTLNENEKESKNKLHLPYFDAQRKDISEEGEIDSVDVDDDDFDDEEDEEV